MKISVFGSGYVGLVQAAVLAEVGHDFLPAARTERGNGQDHLAHAVLADEAIHVAG